MLPRLKSRPSTVPARAATPLFAKTEIPAVEQWDGDISTPLYIKEGLTKPTWRNVQEIFDVQEAKVHRHETDWDGRTSRIISRKSKWLERFADELDDSQIIHPPPTREELREERIVASGWQNIKIPTTDLTKPLQPVRVQPLRAYPDHLPSVSLCHYCKKGVALGAESLRCVSCPLLIHLACLPQPEEFRVVTLQRQIELQQRLVALTQQSGARHHHDHNRRRNNRISVLRASSNDLRSKLSRPSSYAVSSISQSLSRDGNNAAGRSLLLSPSATHSFTSSSLSRRDVEEPTARDYAWTCPFCRSALAADSQADDLRRWAELHYRLELVSVIRIQAFCRMFVCQSRYTRYRQAVIILQECFRLKRFAMAAEKEKLTQSYSFRMRIHDITMLMVDPHYAAQHPEVNIYYGNYGHHSLDKNSTDSLLAQQYEPFPEPANPYVVGEITARKYEKLFGAERLTPQAQSSSPVTPSAASPTSKQMLGNRELLKLLTTGHVDNPQFARSYRNIQILHKGTMFLTVTILEHPEDLAAAALKAKTEDNDINSSNNAAAAGGGLTSGLPYRKPVQISRLDLLLKEIGKPTKVTPSILQRFGLLSTLTPAVADKLCKLYVLRQFSAPRPYILVPFSKADVDVKMTVSQVSEWPKAIVMGQAIQNARYNVMRHRVTTRVSCLQSEVTFTDLPAQEEGSKLTIVLPKFLILNRLKGSSAGGGGSRMKTGDNKSEGEGGFQLYKTGFISWTLIALGDSEHNGAGFLYVLSQEAVSSTKKKCWVLLIDRCLFVYNISRDSNTPKYIIDLRASLVTSLPDEVFRLKSAMETLYFHSPLKHEQEIWLRKMYTQSASQLTMPYHMHIKRKVIAPIRASFSASAAHHNHGHNPHGHSRSSAHSKLHAKNSDSHHNRGSNAIGAALSNLNIRQSSPIRSPMLVTDKLDSKHDDSSSPSHLALMQQSRSPSSSLHLMSPSSPQQQLQRRASSYSFKPPPLRRTRSSMEEVEGLEDEIDSFLDRMQREYIELNAKMLPEFRDPYAEILAKKKRPTASGKAMLAQLASTIAHGRQLF